jgi:hypothetical protein
MFLLCTAVLAGGASHSLAPDLNLATRCLVILIGPIIVATFLLGGGRYFALAGLAALYLTLLVARTVRTWRTFWEASASAEREIMLGSAERKRAETERASLVAAVANAPQQVRVVASDRMGGADVDVGRRGNLQGVVQGVVHDDVLALL